MFGCNFMKLLRNIINHHELSRGVVASIGNFDGVHLGHQHLLTALREQSIQRKLPMLVIIFEPQAREFFTPDNAPLRISPLRDKLRFLQDCGVDYVLCLRFNQKLANMPAEKFAEQIIFESLHVKYLLVGDDFKFGKNRLGNFKLLNDLSKKYACEVANCSDYLITNHRISSTAIRQLLTSSEFNAVKALLGRQYSICGKVVSGDAQARKWGVPTANLHITQLPLVVRGVYCVQIKLKKGIILPGVANVGHRPTVSGKRQVLEVHVIGFSGTLYGEYLEVFFLKKLREEMKFSSVDELVIRIKKDLALAKEYFLKH